ncbi:TonB-dependent receptor [Undibacterium terreum]|uniref:TonB-dependent receptor n=1 Tax=Undibacterium terreum TaxID=1224302 RepID=A0A916UTJ8_9BURK|nr:TonB-dependent receptor [Undibacterium terreum]GGC86961.1 TonB-dependent receptor [Undibacterium terreum]
MKKSGPFNPLPSRLSMLAVACQLVCLGLSANAMAQTAEPKQTAESTESSDVKRVTITGRKVGTGLMVDEDIPKARSTVTREELLKQRPTGNAYQALDLLPAVNSYNYDATGLFGGGLTLRGFNSDQIGFTVNGVPVNDSGSFSVFPQEFVDQENTCTNYVTQGSTDVDSPHVGATGGNIGIVTCDPEKVRRIRVMQTFGQLSMYKSFVRFDTGLLPDERTRFFISASHARSDKWKGPGQAQRNHLDLGGRIDFDRFNYINGNILVNSAVNNNINSISLADLTKNGYYYDFSPTFTPGHLPGVKGTAQNETGPTPQYYKLATNPFQNVIASATGQFRLNENTDLKILPYFWYGYGTGGVQQKAVSETGFLSNGKLTGAVDLNGDGDTLDKILVSGSSVTRTQRPGITASITRTWDNHTLLGGFWYERATHRQTGPIVPVDASGNPADVWLRDDNILRPNGTPYESRDWVTISTAWQAFLQDTISLMDNRLTINVGVRAPHVKRDFTNYANEGGTLPTYNTTYNVQQTYSDVLPQLGVRYQIDTTNQLYASLAKNMKAPPNFAFAPTSNNVQFVNGVATITGNLKEETAWNLDAGYRHQSDSLTAQVDVFNVDFKNRQGNAYDPIADKSIYTNVGNVSMRGFEVEVGNKPVNGWSFYASLSHTRSKVENDVVFSKTSFLPTNGKNFSLTPEWKYGVSAQYETGAFYGRLKAKHTSGQWATLMNDEFIPSYDVVDFDAGYQFDNWGMMKKPTLRLNVSNIFNTQYRNPSSATVLNSKPINGVSASTVFYYLGSPRFASVTLSADF